MSDEGGARLYREDADLYDIAFDWDVSAEAAWLHERLGSRCRHVLEPGCGSGRMLEALARRGLHVTGIDISEPMLELARRRLASAGLAGQVVLADMTRFDLGRRFDGAVCPINTLMHLSRAALAEHLRALSQALDPGARYLVQLALIGDETPEANEWEAERDGVRLRVTWAPGERFDDGTELQLSRIEVLTGPRAGAVHEEAHTMTLWTAPAWADAVAAAGFEWVAVYDGNAAERPQMAFDATGALLWHELARP